MLNARLCCSDLGVAVFRDSLLAHRDALDKTTRGILS